MIELIPHPKAPLFSGPDGLKKFKKIVQEMASGKADLGDKEVQEIVRQAGFVNLWFFLKAICSYSGPFELLNEDLHMSMCNFRQSLLKPGCRGALFVPRDTFKCRAEGEMIQTVEGLKKVEDIRKGDFVFSADSYNKIEKVVVREVYRSESNLKEVTLTSGHIIKVGEGHKFKTLFGFEKVETLKIGRLLAVASSKKKELSWEKIKSIKNIGIGVIIPIMVGGNHTYIDSYGVIDHNTTIFTEGASAWELLRNPELRIRITNQIAGKAEDFMHTVKDIFDSNPFFAVLYPEYVPVPNQERWNQTEIVLPNRVRKRREASVESGGVGGASEGHHYDLHVIDDMIGLAALNAGHQSGAEMARTRNWFWGSEKTLLQSMKTSRVLVVGTRYAVDDVYDDIIARACENFGTPMRDFKPAETGKWQIYYRQAIENGESIFPEQLTLEGLKEMAEDDYWTYVTQYLNDPQAAGLAEFNEYKVKKCFLEANTIEVAGGENILIWNIRFFRGPQEEVIIPLSSCDVIVACDPAASERYMSAKTSRSAVGVIATDSHNNHFILALRADYVKVTTMFDWLFAEKRKFKEYIRATFLEAMGAFKVLLPIIREEETRRGENLNIRPVHVVGEKEARIRTILQPVLEQGRLYIDEHFYDLFWDEQRAFPQSQKKDILDMTSLGVKASIRPLSDAEKTEQRRAEKRLGGQHRGITGY